MNHLRLKASALALAVSSAFLVACGGGSSSGSTSAYPTRSTGLAIDGPLAGAIVTFKDCGNQTTTTAADGTFTFPAGCSQSEITITGGVDTTSGLEFTGELQAPAVAAANNQTNHVIVSPITTLINYANGETAAVITALGLPIGTDPLKSDPLTDKELLIKTFVVQQLIEQVQKTIIALGGSDAEALQATTQAVTSALLSTAGPVSLSDTNFIHDVVVDAVEKSKESLPTDIQANLGNVTVNVAALTTQTIAQNVNKVQTALENLDFSTATDPIETIKNATQQEIVAAKEAITIEQLVTVFSEVIIQSLDSAQLDALKTISRAIAYNEPDPIQAALTTLPSTSNPIEMANVVAASFYKDYFKLDRFSLNNQNYSSVELNNSLVMPIATNMTKFADLTNFTLTLNAFGNLVNTRQQFSATLRIKANDKNILVHINNISADFDNTGHLTAASIPNGAQVYLTSNLQSLTYNNTVTVSNTINALVENGKLTFNTAMLSALSPNLESTLSSYTLSAGTIVTIEAIVSPDERIIAVNDAYNQPQVAKPLTLSTYSGRGVNAKFQINP